MTKGEVQQQGKIDDDVQILSGNYRQINKNRDAMQKQRYQPETPRRLFTIHYPNLRKMMDNQHENLLQQHEERARKLTEEK